jgi:hypothetical protein
MEAEFEVDLPGGNYALGDERPMSFGGVSLGVARIVKIEPIVYGVRLTFTLPRAALDLLNSEPEPLDPDAPERVVRLSAHVGAGDPHPT